jgi:hypothetical protein
LAIFFEIGILKIMFRICLLLAVVFSLLTERPALAQSSRPTFGRKQVNSGTDTSTQGNFTFNSTLDELIDDSSTYDPHTLWVMESMTDITQPFWDPYDVDYSRNNRAVTKVATIQGGRSLSALIKGSELKSTFDSLKRGLDDVKSVFNYSIQSDGKNTYLSKDKKGTKILELSMEFNLSQGMDPNIKIGDHVRFRYDYVNSRPLIEFGINF